MHVRRAAVVLFACAACGGTASRKAPPALTAVTVSPAGVALAVGQQQALAVEALYDDGSALPVTDGNTWISSAPGVATVSAAGVVTADGPGAAIVSLASRGLTAAVAVSVSPAPLSSIAFAGPAPALAAGESRQLAVVATYADSSSAALSSGLAWQTSAAAVATVNATGLVTGVAAGTATITASAGALQTHLDVTVRAAAPGAPAGAVFFAGAYAGDVSFADAPGATNDLSLDAATSDPAGHAALRIRFPSTGFTGGAFVAAAARDLGNYDALTFWAKASAPLALDSVGLGDGASSSELETDGLAVGVAWQKYRVPLPAPGKPGRARALASFRDATHRAPLTLWVADLQYETVGSAALGAVSLRFTGGARTVEKGAHAALSAADLELRVGTTPLIANLSYYALTSDAPAVAAVDSAGGISALATGAAQIKAALGAVQSSNALSVTVVDPTYDPGAGWSLAWSDEFDGVAVNPANWTFDIGSGGWGNNESEYYRAENAVVANGYLTITARQETFGDAPYTSARMQTSRKQAFTYGKFVMRARLPYSQAMWPAFWMLGASSNSFNLYGGNVSWPGCGEIDIMEMIGGLADGSGDYTTHGTLHYLNAGGRDPGPSYAYRYPARLSEDFHVYEIVWTPHSFTWKLDGLAYGTRIMDPDMQALNQPMFLLLNLAVGGPWGGWVDGSTVFPQTYVIDYVRQYTNPGLTSGGAPGLSSTWHLMNGAATGVPAGAEDLESAKGTVSGFQPLKTLTAPATWYSAPLTGAYEDGAWSLGLFTTSPGAAAVLKAEVFLTAADGTVQSSLGTAQVDVNTTGAGNHRSNFTLVGVPALHLASQRLKLVLTPVSGASATMVYNGNDFDSVLTAPWSPAGP